MRPKKRESPLRTRRPRPAPLLLALAALALAALALAVTAAIALSATPVPAKRTTTSTPSVEAYSGLGSWIDIHDARAWDDPEAAVVDLASHGVRTLFLQTGNSTQPLAVFDPPAQETFIRAAHERDMRVIAWYLPDMEDVAYDFARVTLAVDFLTSDGQGFDGFALDIESTAVRDEAERNRALADLSRKIRDLVGADYPLGAIIPSPVSVAKQAGHWDSFPYEAVAAGYEVILPMGYYTYDGNGAAVAKQDTLDNVRILRKQPGCAKVPVHLIGGLAHTSSGDEVQAFVDASRDSGCIGASLYDWAGTGAAGWKALQTLGL